MNPLKFKSSGKLPIFSENLWNIPKFNKEERKILLVSYWISAGRSIQILADNREMVSSEIRGSKFHSIDLIQDPLGCDLESALDFHKTYSEAVVGRVYGMHRK